MHPTPIHTSIVTFISSVCQANKVQRIIITTVDIRLIFRDLLSISSSDKSFRYRGTKLRRYRSLATICDEETTKPSAVDITAASIPTPNNAANQEGNKSINNRAKAWLLSIPSPKITLAIIPPKPSIARISAKTKAKRINCMRWVGSFRAQSLLPI